MRYKTLTLAMLLCVAGALATAQTQTSTMSEPAASPVTHSAQGAAADNSMDMSASPEPAAPAPVTVEKQTMPEHPKKAHKKDAASNQQSDDSGKSPYWEPKDWTYIYNQGP